MRKLVGIVLGVFAIFFMAACGDANEIDILPGIELVGDSVMEVEQDSVFVDPGVGILNDFELDVVVVSDVDTSIVGDYTITYTITYLTIEYDVSRTVRVVDSGSAIIPGIQLVGETIMLVEQYSSFVDPGVGLSGVLDLNIVVESNVDTSILGTYTITYTITYMEIDYSVSRSVEVVFELVNVLPDLFVVTLEAGIITGTSISVVITVDDEDTVIGNRFVRIYEGSTLIDSLPYVNGVNNIKFSDLDEYTTYLVKVTGEYLENSNSALLYGYELELTTLEVGELSFSFDDQLISTSVIEFGLTVVDEDDVLTDLELKVYDGETLIETIELFDDLNLLEGEVDGSFVWISINGLDELTEYSFVYIYTTIPVGETEEVTDIADGLIYTTLESVTPEFVTNTCSERYYTLECVLDIDYSGYEGYYVYAKLYKDDVFVESVGLEEGYTTYSFEYLTSNTDYRIDIIADFTVTATGGIYDSVLISSIDVGTLEEGVLVPPIIENVVITNTETTITVEFDVSDIDSVMDRGIIYLKAGSSTKGQFDIVEGHNTFTFENYIYENTLYTVQFNVDYNGDGFYPTLYEENVFIPPVITLNSYVPANVFYTGDDVIMKLDIDNDEDFDIDFVTIQGTRYSTFIFPSDNEVLYINLGVKLTANHPVNLQSVIITFEDLEYIIDVVSSASIKVHATGSIDPNDSTVSVIDIVPQSNYAIIDRDNPNAITSVLVDIYLENDYDLAISSIELGGILYSGLEVVSITSTHIQLEVDFSWTGNSNSNLWFNEITFTRNDVLITSSEGSHTTVSVVEIYDFDNDDTANDIIHISTPQDLMDIANVTNYQRKAYVLDNDIDMSGYDFSPIGTLENSFQGSFNGNGYTISNITINRTFDTDNENNYVGLFGYGSGLISNLNIDNLNIDVTSTDDNYLYVGALSGKFLGNVYDVNIYNSTIIVAGVIHSDIGGLVGNQSGDVIRTNTDVDITIVSFSFATSNMRLYVGGLIGNKIYNDVRNSSSSGDITIAMSSSYTMFVGGLVGALSDSGSMTSNSYATGNIDVTANYYSRVGGLIGQSYGSSVDNSYASGNINSVSGETGGLIGDSDGIISSSFAIGTVTGDAGFVGRIFGSGNTYKFDLMYSFDEQLVYHGDTFTSGSDYLYIYLGEASSTQFNDANYYSNLLGWSSHFYDFSNLDIVNGDIPVFSID